MKIVPLVTFARHYSFCRGTHGGCETAKEFKSIRQQIKADLAKAKADEENGPKSRFWDRDADGKRPWERPLPKE